MDFSFGTTNVEMILRRAHLLIPGITKVMSVSNYSETEITQIRFITHPTQHSIIESLVPDDRMREAAQKLGGEKNPVAWYSEDDVPLFANNEKIMQLNAFDEFDKTILMLSIPRDDSKLPDLFFFFFNENISNFAITHHSKVLHPENKAIISTLLYNSITAILDNARTDRLALKFYNSQVDEIIASMKSAQSTIEGFKEKHDSVILNYAYQIIAETPSYYGNLTYALSKSATDKIKEFNGELRTLKEALKKAMKFARGRNIGNGSSKIILDDFHLNFKEEKSMEPKPEAIQPASRKAKTIALLDHLEEAAVKVLKQNKRLTGASVSEAYFKNMTPPGISDALKKHEKTIKVLVNDYPDKWRVIKNDFKPLMNVLRTRLPDEKKDEDQA